jgi:hypothetical protein
MTVAPDGIMECENAENDARERAFAMPLTSPAYPPGPIRFTPVAFPDRR